MCRCVEEGFWFEIRIITGRSQDAIGCSDIGLPLPTLHVVQSIWA